MRNIFPFCLLAVVAWGSLSGCEKVSKVMGSNWHTRCGWKAEDYFDDPKVITLCKAIEADDIAAIDRAVKAGADVNAKGKGNMTPLLWAYPDNKLARFERLLELGADPNVIFESDFNSHGGITPGGSVTHMACTTAFADYFNAVFEHGGNANLIASGDGQLDDSPLHLVITLGVGDKKDKIRMLLKNGANVDYLNGAWATPVMQAVSWGGQYDLALMLLEAGADYRIYIPHSNEKLVHVVALQEGRKASWTAQQASDYKKLVEWLEGHGESLKEANADIKRWQSWNHASGEYRRNLDAEIAVRKQREKEIATSNGQNQREK